MNNNNKILVIDSDTVNREFFQVMLVKLGFAVEEAGDGQEALGKLKKFRPDLILMDNIMPRMSGFELTKNLKDDPKYRNIPIIMFSALDDVKNKVAGFELGIDDYITKPFNFSEVLARIKAVLRNRELFSQIAVRETRLSLAEELSCDTKKELAVLASTMNELEAAVSLIQKDENLFSQKPLAELVKNIFDKTDTARRHIAELDAKIDKTILEWEDIKKNEIGLSVLETEIRKHINQEQQ